MTNILFVSIAFPPKLDPECIQTAKYFKYLQQNDELNIDVVTSTDDTLFMAAEKSMEVYDYGFRQKIKVKIFENKYLNYLMRKIDARLLERPDSKFWFHRQWKKVVRNLKNRPDVIYARANPLSSAIMALKLKEYYKVPLVLHLSDGCADFYQLSISPKSFLYYRQMEETCFHSASKVNFTSEKMTAFYQEKYPKLARKFEYFPNVYDTEDALPCDFEFKEKLKFVYTGGFYFRSPLSLFKAIEQIEKTNPEILETIEFVFVGENDRINANLFEQYNQPCVQHLGKVSYSASLKLQRSADVLMLFDTRLNGDNLDVFLPSKLLDYMLIQRKIMAVTFPNSTVHQITQDKYGQCYNYEDYAGIADFILECHKQFVNNNKSFFINPEPDALYSAEPNAKRLSKLLIEVANA